jgi:UDP-3-O-[3-hydroxymyristoyl] glucosamine N-acyltransferase
VVENAVVAAGASIGEGSTVVGSIVGADAHVGSGCALAGMAVVGPGAQVGGHNRLDHGLRIGAGAIIPEEALRFS